jgi:hypothetical protein
MYLNFDVLFVKILVVETVRLHDCAKFMAGLRG